MRWKLTLYSLVNLQLWECKELSTTRSAETSWEWKTVDHGKMQYAAYVVLSVWCTRGMVYSVYFMYACTQCMLSSVYAILAVCCTRGMLYSVSTLDHGMERYSGMT